MADLNTLRTDTFLTTFHFNVTFVGLNYPKGLVTPLVVPFAEVSGISTELQTEDVTEGGTNLTYHLPKPSKPKNLVLKRALATTPSPTTRWAEAAINNMEFHPCTVLVSILNNMHMPVANWVFTNAYPIKLELSSLNASKGELVIQTLELAYLQLKRLTVPL